jgi:hypothetical protein
MRQNIQPLCLLFCFQVSMQYIHQTIRIIILLSSTSGFWHLYSALVMLTGKIKFYKACKIDLPRNKNLDFNNYYTFVNCKF